MKRRREDADDGEAGDRAKRVCPDRSIQVIRGGCLLLKKFLTSDEQQEVANTCAELGIYEETWYCRNEKAKDIHMMTLGRESGARGTIVRAIPAEMLALAARAAAAASTADKTIPLLAADMCVINYYTPGSKLSLHQDRLSLSDAALPVVAFSVGDTAEFVAKPSWKKGTPLRKILLESGDVLVFGGKSSTLIHGVERVLPGTAPGSLRMHPGRLNINFRQY